jgi:predicted DNA-binding transcriptional regulator AlpA
MNGKHGAYGKYFEKEEKRREAAAKAAGPPTPRQDDADIMVTVHEAAAMCKMSKTTFYKLHASGKTPRRVKLGALARWRRQEILDWIKAGCPSREKWEAMSGKQRR